MNPISAEIHALEPGRVDDFLLFFDLDAFPPGHEWASCYCYAYQSGCSDREWTARTAAQNRAATEGLIRAGRMHGYLTYLEGKPVAWCHAAPRTQVRYLLEARELSVEDAERVGSIICFVVARGFRRRGLAAQLLKAACDGFRSRGLAIAEAYPRKGSTSDEVNYKGPPRMYQAAGFVQYKDFERFSIVRKRLLPDAPEAPGMHRRA